MKYNEDTIEKLYKENLTRAHNQLASLLITEGRKPNIKGLNGWVFEQTIRYCLLQELSSLGLTPGISDQEPLCGRVKIDLVVDNKLAVEIKAGGSFGDDTEKYKKYRAKVEEKGWKYFHLTKSETHNPYRLQAVSTFGEECTFFLDKEGDWTRFVNEVIKALQ